MKKLAKAQKTEATWLKQEQEIKQDRKAKKAVLDAAFAELSKSKKGRIVLENLLCPGEMKKYEVLSILTDAKRWQQIDDYCVERFQKSSFVHNFEGSTLLERLIDLGSLYFRDYRKLDCLLKPTYEKLVKYRFDKKP